MKNLMIILCSVFVMHISATIINIPADQPTIQAGIGVAVDSDTVLVQPGTYYENINYNGKNITIASLFLTTQDTTYISQTIIDGNQNGSVVTFESGEDSTAVLCGFTITNGNANNYGGGIYCYQSNPNITDVTICNNTSSYKGGGIYCINSNLNLNNIILLNNAAASRGGGIYCNDSNPSMENMVIRGNNANVGGGIDCSNSDLILENVILSGNSAINGGGIYCYDSDLDLEKVTITANIASNKGAGFYLLSDCIINFHSENRCSIYSNNSQNERAIGKDIYFHAPENTINVIVDTFTVINPTNNHAYPLENFTFDILNGAQDQINADVYVSPTGNNANSGLNANDPFQTIQFALSRIYVDEENQNTIFLAPGIYSPQTNGEYFPLDMLSYLSLKGTSEIETILNADDTNSVISFFYADSANVRDLTITNGNSTEDGGGVFCYNSDARLENVTLSNNIAYDNGGGIFCWFSNPTLVNVTISGNSAINGAGINCYIDSSPILMNVLINNNSASGKGGGIYCNNTNLRLFNVSVTNNIAQFGGGVYCMNYATPSLRNCISYNNQPQEIYFREDAGPSSISIAYSDIQGGEAGIVVNGNGTVNWLEGNIDQDPLFVGIGEHPFELTEFSPCIDAGIPDTTGMNLPPFDLLGNLRIWDGDCNGSEIIDMGAYEYGAPPYVEIDDDIIIQAPEVILHQNYPNPFNPSTTISFSIPEVSNVKLSVFNIKGQKVKQIVSEQLSAGQHSINWNGDDESGKAVSSGIYYYKLDVNGKTEAVKKCLLLK
ncbi:MAG: FlgD immunoglobulin-like domain containing protein [Candidatus Cloacimonadales bacterium]|nr:FlgD immunoglobulin-like domain containing protein [Candidatus Cloacimonadales bacterium]